MGRDKVTIKIPRELYERLQKVVEETGFGSVTEFIVFVMRDLLAAGQLQDESGLDRREVELIRNRLRTLGYLE
jgi:Arc/MetJ-type ribon-helix-helix transcriptional regulator